MKKFVTCTLLLGVLALVTESWCARFTHNMKMKHVPRHLPRQSTSEMCEIIRTNFTAGLQFATEECRIAIEPLFPFSDFQNVTASEVVAAAICNPACQSWYDLRISCSGQLLTERFFSFYCGRNSQGQACYEAAQSNDDTQAACIQNGDINCTASCDTEVQNLISNVGCCVHSFPYSSLFAAGRPIFSTCGFTVPEFCTHLFTSESSAAAVATAAYTSLFTAIFGAFILLY